MEVKDDVKSIRDNVLFVRREEVVSVFKFAKLFFVFGRAVNEIGNPPREDGAEGEEGIEYCNDDSKANGNVGVIEVEDSE